jgi:hypothetical protein
MRYMMFMKHPRDYGDSQPPAALYEAMGAFVGEMIENGTFIDGAGLQPLAKGTRVRLTGDKVYVTDGPFAEAKEVVGGYALIEARTHAEAVALGVRFMELHRKHWPGFEGESEIRPLEETA